MASSDRERKDSGESAPLLQQPGRNGPPSSQSRMAPPSTGVNMQHQYGATGNIQGYPPSQGMPVPLQYDPNNPMGPGSTYFVPVPGQYPPQQGQGQQNPVILNSPNQPNPQMVGPGGSGVPQQAPFYYPFPPTQGGAMPQYQYPVYPMQQQRQQPGGGQNPAHATTGSGGLPALNDIFSSPMGKDPQAGGYGSTSTSPKIYNAPVRLPPSGRPPQQQQQQLQQQQAMARTKEHRRVHSDNPLRLGRMHKRANSNEVLPPRGHNRSRTLSGGNLVPKPRHRRADSSSSYHSMGGGSYGGSIADSSMVSMRSNIAKSSMFGGVDQEGRPILYYPYEAIRLVMIPDPKKKDENRTRLTNDGYDEISDEDTEEQEDYLPLTIGHLYAEGPVNMDDYYENYHRVSDQLEQGLTPQWESLDTHPLKRKSNGSENLGKQDLLPPTNYVVAISDDIYRRMFAEVSDASTMPCGLFFCGHHEDVDHPSVWIPATLVIILFGTMFYLAYTANDLS